MKRDGCPLCQGTAAPSWLGTSFRQRSPQTAQIFLSVRKEWWTQGMHEMSAVVDQHYLAIQRGPAPPSSELGKNIISRWPAQRHGCLRQMLSQCPLHCCLQLY